MKHFGACFYGKIINSDAKEGSRYCLWSRFVSNNSASWRVWFSVYDSNFPITRLVYIYEWTTSCFLSVYSYVLCRGTSVGSCYHLCYGSYKHRSCLLISVGGFFCFFFKLRLNNNNNNNKKRWRIPSAPWTMCSYWLRDVLIIHAVRIKRALLFHMFDEDDTNRLQFFNGQKIKKDGTLWGRRVKPCFKPE